MSDPAAESSARSASAVLAEAGASLRRSRRRRRIAAAVAALFALVVAWRRHGGSDDDAATFRTQALHRDRLVVTVSASGTLEPTDKVEVGSELSGIVDTVSVDYNDRVHKGQVLAKLDTTKLEAEALQAQAELDAAEATLAENRATVVEAAAESARMEALRRASNGRIPSRQDFDASTAKLARAQAAVESAKARIELARAKLDFDRTNLSKAEIRSPIDGVVLTREVEPGQTIAASLQAPKLFTLAQDLAQMELEADVDEADVGQVREGQEASFTVDAFPERRFPARITQLRFASETVDGVVTYKAVLQVANADLALRPGMTATAEIVVATVADALLLPNEALRFVPPRETKDDRGLLQKLMPFGRRLASEEKPKETTGSTRTVYVLKDGKPSALRVEVGLSDGSYTQVVSGDLGPASEVVVDTTAKAAP